MPQPLHHHGHTSSRLLAIMVIAFLLTGCSGPSLSLPRLLPPAPPGSATPIAPAAVASHQIAPAPPTPPFPPQPDAAVHPLVPQMLSTYAKYLDALNSFYRGQDASLKAVSTPEQFAHQVSLRKSWNGDQAQEQLIVPHVRVVIITPDDVTLADTSVYRTSWLRSNGLPIPVVVKAVRVIEHFQRDAVTNHWLFADRLDVAPDVELPNGVIQDDTKAR